MSKSPKKEEKDKGAGKLGALEHRYGSSKILAREATKDALQKATDKKMLNPGKTATGQPADAIDVDPEKPGMQSQTYN